MDKWDQEKFAAIMEAGCDEVSDIDDLINLTYNLDCYDIIPDVHDESDLGYYYVHEAGIYEEKDLGPLANYIDYERLDGIFGWMRMAVSPTRDISAAPVIAGTGILTVLWIHPGRISDHRKRRSVGKDEKLLAVVVEPGKQAEFRDIDSGLEALQGLVGGDIQAIYPYDDPWQLSAMTRVNSKVSRSTAPCVMKAGRFMTLLPGHLRLSV